MTLSPPQNQLYLLFLFLFFLIFQFSSARNHPDNSHTVDHTLAKKRAEKLLRSFNLSPKHPVTTIPTDTINSELEVSDAEFVEKQLKFPSVIAAAKPGPSIQQFGHYAGYIKLPRSKAARIFYYFFESRGKKTDPVVIWLTGGPGCSSSIALFYENGPFHITKNFSLVWNPYGWDQASNILFVDQPVGTGFSYTTDDSDYCHDEECVSNDLYDFLQVFFKHHPQFVKNDFYVTGESYAGHYVPAVTSRINKGNKGKEGVHINLKGMAIGNGLTNPKLQYPAYPVYALNTSIITSSEYVMVEQLLPDCVKSAEACETGGEDACISSFDTCNGVFDSILSFAGNINYYDIRKQCEGDLCYDFSAVGTFLNEKGVKKALGVGNLDWQSCNTDVYTDMEGDWMKNLAVGIPELLEDGIKVLLYAGEYDLICNWLGNSWWVNAMSWSGQKAFVSAPNVSFVVAGKEAGLLRSYGPLAFLKVYNAGHMVPMDQPRNALQMLKRWMLGKLSV